MTTTESSTNQLLKWVVAQLDAHQRPEAIAQQLAAEGIDYDQALQYVSGVEAELTKVRRAHKWKASIFGWVGLVVMFLILNGALYVGQEIYHRGHKAQAESLKAKMAGTDAQIAVLSLRLQQVATAGESIDRLAERLSSPTNFASRAEYESALRDHDQRVAAWNAQLPQVNALEGQYEQLVASYNASVDEYNAVAKKAYSRWWLIPVPGGRHVDVPTRAAP